MLFNGALANWLSLCTFTTLVADWWGTGEQWVGVIEASNIAGWCLLWKIVFCFIIQVGLGDVSSLWRLVMENDFAN